jgi:hypothetical protein
MLDNVKVPWNTRLSKVAEHVIASRLSRFSTINKYDMGVGIDYYCELVEKDSPTISFLYRRKEQSILMTVGEQKSRNPP